MEVQGAGQAERELSANGSAIAPDVTVVVVTYNSADVIDRFLDAICSALDGIPHTETIIVDNASTDGTVQRTRERAPWAVVRDAGANLGYGAGINLGLAHASPRKGVMVLNPDTVPEPGSIRRLADAAEGDPSVGIVVPRLVGSDGHLSHSLRREPTISRAFGEAVLGGRLASRFTALGETVRTPRDYTEGGVADWATGAAMFISRRALDAVSEWPEDYFLYSEETHYALAVRDEGLRLQLVPSATVVHRGGDLARSPWLWSLRTVNRFRLYRRRHGPVASAVYWVAVALNEAIRLGVSSRTTHWAALRALARGPSATRTAKPPQNQTSTVSVRKD